MLLNQQLQRDRYKQFFFNGLKVVEEEFDVENNKTLKNETCKKTKD